MSEFRNRLLTIQRSTYLSNLRAINRTLKPSPPVERYAADYRRCVKSYAALSTKAELIRRVLAADCVFHGDYHPLKQSQRSVFRVLREIVGKRPLVLCLEVFQASHQKQLDAYMKGTLEESAFLDKVEYSRLWGYPWEHWKPILDLCRTHGIGVLGINTVCRGARALERRDRAAGRIIAKAVIRNPGALIYTVCGDYHICPPHLPAVVEELLDSLDEQVNRLIIYQNSEELYWKLAAENREEADVLQLGSGSFCIMNSTPAVKLQSYLNWLERSSDAWYPVHADWSEEGTDATSVPGIAATICSMLGLPEPKQALERLGIYYSHDLNFMSMLHRSPRFRPMLGVIERRIRNAEGFLLEFERGGTTNYLIYLATSNLNMAAEEASHFVNAVCRGTSGRRIASFDLFYRGVVTEALGFFGSKLINERRKALSVPQLRRLLGRVRSGRGTADDRNKAVVARLILRHHFLEHQSRLALDFQKGFHRLYQPSTEHFEVVSTQLGYLLGNKLYYAVKRGMISTQEIRGLFSNRFDRPLEAFNTYLSLMGQVGEIKEEHEGM